MTEKEREEKMKEKRQDKTRQKQDCRQLATIVRVKVYPVVHPRLF